MAGMIAIVFVLTIVKAVELGDASKLEAFDRVVRPAIIPQDGAAQ